MWQSWWGKAKATDEGEEESVKQDSDTQASDGRDQSANPVVTSWVKGLGSLVETVGGYASSLTETVKSKVAETTSVDIVAEFEREQEQFRRQQTQLRGAAVPPWVGYNEEEQMKAQMMELSSDSRNVLRDPPPGVEFHFDYKHSAPVAMATMKEDTRLKQLRYDLVPKKISEEMFWRNYFYRVSLIKQSVQLTSLASANATEPMISLGQSSPPPHTPDDDTATPTSDDTAVEQVNTSSGHDDTQSEEFASDQPYNMESVSKEAVQSELNQLGVQDNDSTDPSADAWEAELEADLDELCVTAEDQTDNNWEEELEQMLDIHSEQSS